MATRFIPVDRATPSFLPPSIDELLPKNHLARFVVDIVERLDLSRIEASYGGRGSAAYHPSMLVALLIYGYATGTFTSRRLEEATYDSIAFRYITANQQPDHNTIAHFRRRFLGELESLFTQVLVLAAEMDLLTLGNVSLDGTKIKANASKHTALSYEYATRLEEHLKREVELLLRRAEAAERRDEAEHLDIPKELHRREDRLKAIAKAKAKIEQRAERRYGRESAEYDKKMADREKKAEETAKKPKGRTLYAKRKCTVEPVFGIIKHVMGFRQFNLRGLENVRGEWTLVSLAWNLKRMAKLYTVAG